MTQIIIRWKYGRENGEEEERGKDRRRVIWDEEGREVFRKKMALKKTIGEAWRDRIENKKRP